jgi:outer membrane protein OmpA-like peptidoglycan-associated protein
VRRLTERVEMASTESVSARDQLARARMRVSELEGLLTASEDARIAAEGALDAAEHRIASLEDELEGVHVRIVSLNAVLASAETGHLVEARLGLQDTQPDAANGEAVNGEATDGGMPSYVQARLEALGAEPIRHGTLITVPGDRLFAFDSRDVQSSAYDVLRDVAEVLRHFEERDVLIVGHTDATGDPGYNQLLSERRADAVREFFVRRFALDPARFKTAGMSDSRPIAANDTAEGRSANRRVEVVIQNQDVGPTLAGANGASSAAAR